MLRICPAFSGKMASVLISWPDTDTEDSFLLHFLDLSVSLAFFSLSSALQVDVTVDLRPEEPEIPLHRDIVLLLRCDKSVNWVIKAHNIIGKLHIVVCRHVYAQLSFAKILSLNVFDQPKHVWCLRYPSLVSSLS